MPGVSAQVSRLERELGAPLIDRSGGTATLTAAGAAVLELAGRRLGVAVLSASMLTGRDDLTTIQIRDVKRTANLALVWRPGPGPAARELLDYLHTAFGLAPAGP